MSKSLSSGTGGFTVEQRELLAFLLEDEGVAPAGAGAITARADSNDAPLSFAQQRLWFMDRLLPDSPAYNIPTAISITGPLNLSALGQALGEVVRRHAALRTTFQARDFQPVQVIDPSHSTPMALVELCALPGETRESLSWKLSSDEARRPFDLAHGPVVRATVLQLAGNRRLLLFTLHHIVSDGWSMGLLVKEVAAAYRAYISGDPSPLAELPIQYADFASWQREWLQGEALEEQLSYWREKLKGGASMLELPTDRPRPAAQSMRGAAEYFSLPAGISQSLRLLTRRRGVTIFMLLLAAFKVLLHRYTGQEDITIGTPIAGRNRTELENLIGFFVNTLVLRTDLSGNPAFEDLIARVKEVVLGAYARQETPFEALVDHLKPERNLSHTPLFQVMFILQNAPVGAMNLPSLTLSSRPVSAETAKFDLSLGLTDTPEALIGSLEYSTDLFDASTIRRMLGHWQSLLESAVTDPARPISSLSMLSPEEQRQILIEWNDTGREYQLDACLPDWIERQVELTPDATALIFERERMTYRELNGRANQLAHYLRKHGVGPDTLVAICAERSVEMVVGLLGILKAGGAYVPMEPTYPKQRLENMLADSQARVLLTQAHLGAGAPATEAPMICPMICLDSQWERIAEESRANPEREVAPENLAYVIYTSGSTGKPKGAMLTHRGICNRLLWMQEAYQLTGRDAVAQKTPFSFDVSVWEFFWPLMVGARLIVARPGGHQDSRYMVEVIRQEQVTTLHFVPSMLQVMLEEEDVAACSSIRQVISSGEALSLKLQQRFHELMPADLHNLYGPTEASVDVTYWKCDPQNHRQVVPIGRPIANTQIYILDRRLQIAPVGVAGELHIAGVGLARGYLNRPDLTADKFIPSPFGAEPGARLYKTGDLARYLPDGAIEFLGRIDHQVKLRGYRIELGEIEAALESHPAVTRAVVAVRGGESESQRLVAYLEVGEGPEPAVGELRDHLKVKLPEYMAPASYVVMETLPLTPNGKVDRKLLPEPDRSKLEPGREYIAPRTPIEKLLAEVWAKVLRVERVGVNDNFFELGGDSILIMQFIARTNQSGVRFTPRQVFQFQTIAELAAVASLAPAIRAEQGPVTGPAPLTPIQHWFFEQNLTDPHHWNQANLFAGPTSIAPFRLEHAFERLLLHHDALRLRFYPAPSGWQQLEARPDRAAFFAYIELASLPEAEQRLAIETAAEQAQGSLDLSGGPLVRVILFDLGARRQSRLLIVIHHLAIDMVSWRILLEDLQTAYQQSSLGETIQLPPKTSSFKQWSERLTEHAQSEAVRQELPYWLGLPWSQVARLPVDFDGDANTTDSTGAVSVSLGIEETQSLLRDAPKAYNTQINDVLLSAMAMAFAPWTGRRTLLVEMEGHGRADIFDDIDLSRTVGWFTTLYPVLVDLERAFEPGDILKSVKEQLRRLLNQGLGYGLLRYLCRDKEAAQTLSALPAAEVIFNYLGQVEQGGPASPLGRAGESAGPTQSLRSRRPHLLQVNGSVIGGQLSMSWTYSKNLHRRETIEELAQGFMAALRALIAHCVAPEAGGYTPSDLPETGLGQREIDDVLARLREFEV